MRMTIEEARMIGESMLKVDRELFATVLEIAKRVDGMRKDDLGPMTLALAIMGASKVNPRDEGMARELTDALTVVDKAEKEWRLMRRMN